MRRKLRNLWTDLHDPMASRAGWMTAPALTDQPTAWVSGFGRTLWLFWAWPPVFITATALDREPAQVSCPYCGGPH